MRKRSKQIASSVCLMGKANTSTMTCAPCAACANGRFTIAPTYPRRPRSSASIAPCSSCNAARSSRQNTIRRAPPPIPPPPSVEEGDVDLMAVEISPGITVDPEVAFGKPVIKGTRIYVALVLGHLAGGIAYEELEREYDL